MKNLIKREQNKRVCFAESENSQTKFKRMVLCLMAMMGVLTLSAQSVCDFTENPVLSNIMARRSVRKYLDKPVEHAKLETVALAGINAPSAMNRQNWAVRIIEDQKVMADVKGQTRNAPNLICVCAPVDGRFDLDAGLMGENMMLAAQALGLGTCIQTGPIRFLTTDEKAKAFRDSLDIPEGYKLLYVISIGYPDEQPDAKARDTSKVKFIK